uniref:Uncharacterized protein n=1 Tax=Aegilops tauschii subsp. strangulata TaxID=200361 RepID=A0A453JXV5_AEGTS
MAEGRRLDRRGPGCLEGLFKFLALNQKLQTPKLIAYQKHGEGNDNTLSKVLHASSSNFAVSEDLVSLHDCVCY